MERRAKCPSCGTAVTIPAVPGKRIPCPSCGASLELKPPRREAATPAGTVRPPDREDGPTEPVRAPAGTKPGRLRKRPGRAANAPGPNPQLIAGVLAGGVGLVVVLLVCGGAAWYMVGRWRNPGPAAGGGTNVAAGRIDGAGAAGDPTPYDPVPWSVPPAGATPSLGTDKIDLAPPAQTNAGAAGRPGSALVIVPLAGGQGEYLSLRSDPNRGDVRVVRGRFDPQTGGAVEEQVLEDLVASRSARPNVFAEPPTAALAPDGTLAAWRADGLPRLDAPRKEGKVLFWDKGSAKPRPKDGPACSTDHWFDWAANGKLLLVHGGKLTLWDVAAGKPVFEVGQGLQRPVLLAPSRQWLVVRVGKADPTAPGYLEVYDTATGAVRGRFGAGHMTALALSPDGTRLAGVQPSNPLDPGGGLEIHHWDMKTGERQGVIRWGGSPNGSLRWWGPDHVLLAYSRVILQHFLFNVRTNAVEAQVSFPRVEPNVHAYEWPPDGRPWWNYGERLLFTLPLPRAQDDDAVFRPGSTVALEVACGDSATDQRATAVMTDVLRREGFQVGPSGWKLRVKAAKENSGREMTFGFSRVPVPIVKGEIELLAPDGTSVRKAPAAGGFGRGKYFVGMGGAGVEHYEKYDFKGRDPSAAMAEEAWDDFFQSLPLQNWPRTVWQRNGKYEVMREVVIPLPPFLKGK